MVKDQKRWPYPFANRNFFLLWLGSAVSRLGDEVSYIALLVTMYRLTGSATAVGSLLMLQTVVTISMGIAAGVLVDRWDKRKVMAISDLVRCCLIALIGFAAEPWQLFVLAGLMAVASRCFSPAQSALLPSTVPKDDLILATGSASSANQILGIFGPAIGGAVIALVGARGAFLFDAITFAFAAVSILFVSTGAVAAERRVAPGMSGFWAEARAGLTTIAKHQVLRPLVTLVFIALLAVGGINVLLVPFVIKVLGIDTVGYGTLMSVFGAGLLAGSLLAMALARRVPPKLLLVGSLCVIGLTVLPVAVLSSVWAVGALFFLTGAANSVFNVAASVLAQGETPADMQGRVFGLLSTILSVASLASMAMAGFLADLVGVRATWGIAGTLIVVASVYGWFAMFRRQQVAARVAPAD